MNSTSILAEILVIGIGGLLGLILIILSLLGIKIDTEFLQFVKDNASLIIVIGTPITYLIGILIDRLADFCFETRVEDKIKDEVFKNKGFTFSKAQAVVYTKSVELSKVIEYIRSRKRICRGWNINLLLITIGFMLVNTYYLHLLWKNAILIFIFIVLIFILNYKSYSNSVFKEYKTCLDYYENL